MHFRKKTISRLTQLARKGLTYPLHYIKERLRGNTSREENHSHWVVEPIKQSGPASIWQYKPGDQTDNRLHWATKSASISQSQETGKSDAVSHSRWIDKIAAHWETITRFKRKFLQSTLSIIGIALLIFAMKHLQKPAEVPTQAPPPDPPLQKQKVQQQQYEKISRYDPLIRTYADRYGFDWRLIAALIRQESNFDPYARSRAHARGLMQLIPETAKEVGVRHVYNPKENIAGGVLYLRKMYDRFPKIKTDDRIKFALASYNAGIGHILDARRIAGSYQHNGNDWELVQKALFKLTPEYEQLHRNIWGTKEPKHGFFNGAQETTIHVQKVMNYYKDYTTPAHNPPSHPDRHQPDHTPESIVEQPQPML